MTTAAVETPATRAPGVLRRLACFVYEGVLLFGVVMIAGYLFGALTQQRHAMQGHHALQAFLFVVLAIYFVGFWSHGGQTVAMKAWHLRLVRADGGAVSQPKALLRYLLSWLWFLPALLTVYLLDVPRSTGLIFGALAVGVLAYAGLALLHPQRQFWHDAVCGTRLVDWHPKRRSAGASAKA